MSYFCKKCGIVIMEDCKDLCLLCEKENGKIEFISTAAIDVGKKITFKNIIFKNIIIDDYSG